VEDGFPDRQRKIAAMTSTQEQQARLESLKAKANELRRYL
jgi:hypothetical protein